VSKDFSILSKELSGEDLFEGKSHERIADIILKQIEIGKTKLIGIEGKWGSGKSNIIKIIENKIKNSKNEYIFFPYNTWIHQNDLHRRIIPTELYEFIKSEIDNRKNELSNHLKILLGTITETTVNRIPIFSWGMMILFVEVIILPVLNIVFGNAYEKNDISLCDYIIIMISIAFLPPLVLYISFFIKYFKKHKFVDACKKTLLDIFTIYQTTETKEIEDTSITYTKEKNPTFSDFQNFMEVVSSEIGDKKLIIVFDDIDRMLKENIHEFWGTLHNLFADSDFNNIFVIVPFGREQIKTIFDSDEYINKTFDIIYRVSLPILSDYTMFFMEKWNKAFGKVNFPDQYNRVWQIFNNYSENITPRNIIAFINEFVTIKQFFEAVIPDEYIALFIMHKDKILEKPYEKIIMLDFLGNMETFYKDNDEISKYLAALVFQVEPEKALDVVYMNNLKRILNNGSSSEIENISSSKIFFNLLFQILPELDKIDNVIICLDHVSEKMEADPIEKKQVWNDIFKIVMERLETLPIDFKSLLPYQFGLIRNIPNDQLRKYIFAHLKNVYNTDEKFTSIGYYNIALKLKEEADKRDLDIRGILKSITKEIEPEEFIKFVENTKEKYNEVNIICSIKKLDDFLVSKNITELKALDFVKHINEKNKLMRYKKHLNDLYTQNFNNHSNLLIVINRLKDMEELIDISKLQPAIIYNIYINIKKLEPDFIYDLIAIRLSLPQYQDANFNNIFIDYLNNSDQNNELVYKTGNVIQNYITFGDLLKNLNIMDKFPLYINIVHYIIKNKSGKKLNIVTILQNFDMICEKTKLDPQLFINDLSGWLSRLKEKEGKYKYSEIFSVFFVKEILKSDTELAGYCIEKLKTYLDNYSKEDWKQSLSKKDSYELLITKELNYKYNAFAKEAIHEILLEMAKSDEKPVDHIHYTEIINQMSKKGIGFTDTFNSIRDCLCQKGELNNVNFLFWSEWLFKYSNLGAKQEVLRTILPVSLLDNEDCLKIINANKAILPNIIKMAGNEGVGFIDGLKLRLEQNQESTMLKEIAEVLKIKLPKNETKT